MDISSDDKYLTISDSIGVLKSIRLGLFLNQKSSLNFEESNVLSPLLINWYNQNYQCNYLTGKLLDLFSDKASLDKIFIFIECNFEKINKIYSNVKFISHLDMITMINVCEGVGLRSKIPLFLKSVYSNKQIFHNDILKIFEDLQPILDHVIGPDVIQTLIKNQLVEIDYITKAPRE